MKHNPKNKIVLASGKFIQFVLENDWEYVERLNATGVAAIIAVTGDSKLLLAEQYRPPVSNQVIELPAGLAGDISGEEAEHLRVAAERELFEEVGYKAKNMEYLGRAPSSAGLSSQIVSYFRASDLEKVGPGGGNDLENIKIHEVALESLSNWLKKRILEGIYIDPELFTGLYFAGYHIIDKSKLH